MSRYSDFVLRWNFDNPKEGMSSPVIRAGGFEWKAELHVGHDFTMSPSTFDVYLVCNASDCEQGDWSSQIYFDYSLSDGATQLCAHSTTAMFDDGKNADRIVGVIGGRILYGVDQFCNYSKPFPLRYGNSGLESATFECRAKIVRSTKPSTEKPIAHNESGDVTLILGGKKMSVSKELLAQHSPMFEALFFRGFAEKDKEEVELKDVDYEEFSDLRNILGSTRSSDKKTIEMHLDSNILHIIPLADRFAMNEVIGAAEDYLMASAKYSLAEKLLLADMYHLEALEWRCLRPDRRNVEQTAEFKAVTESEEYESFSERIREEICQRQQML